MFLDFETHCLFKPRNASLSGCRLLIPRRGLAKPRLQGQALQRLGARRLLESAEGRPVGGVEAAVGSASPLHNVPFLGACVSPSDPLVPWLLLPHALGSGLRTQKSAAILGASQNAPAQLP